VVVDVRVAAADLAPLFFAGATATDAGLSRLPRWGIMVKEIENGSTE
jgi:hypothetical protein